MSFDLVFVPQSGTSPTQAEILAYFESLPNTQVENGQAVYENEATGVYFIFDFEEPSAARVTLALNFGRPLIFGLEAAEIVEDFLARFPFDVEDPASGTVRAFDRDAFVSAWLRVNDQTSLLDGFKEKPNFPRSRLVEQWRWNRFVQAHDSIVAGNFAARVMYRFEAGVRSFSAVVIDNPTIVYNVDELVLLRSKRPPFQRAQPEFEYVVRPFQDFVAQTDGSPERVEGFECVRLSNEAAAEAEFLRGPRIAQESIGKIEVDGIADTFFVREVE